MLDSVEGGAVDVSALGQAGFRFVFGDTVVYVDPYLSDRVERTEGERFRRLVPRPRAPGEVDDADYVFITHTHADHCDPDTLLPMASASPHCRFVGPSPVARKLLAAGMDEGSIITANAATLQLPGALGVEVVPAAHPAIRLGADGAPEAVGYIFEYRGRRYYHSGDTALTAEVYGDVMTRRPIHVAILPVNERNFFREREGIIGNMSVREALQFAGELGVEVLVPMHWDMFEPNCVFEEEIRLVHRNCSALPPFRLELHPVRL